MTTASARYTYLSSEGGLSRLIDQVNEFCRKYPEYRLMQILTDQIALIAVLTTDPA